MATSLNPDVHCLYSWVRKVNCLVPSVGAAHWEQKHSKTNNSSTQADHHVHPHPHPHPHQHAHPQQHIQQTVTRTRKRTPTTPHADPCRHKHKSQYILTHAHQHPNDTHTHTHTHAHTHLHTAPSRMPLVTSSFLPAHPRCPLHQFSHHSPNPRLPLCPCPRAQLYGLCWLGAGVTRLPGLWLLAACPICMCMCMCGCMCGGVGGPSACVRVGVRVAHLCVCVCVMCGRVSGRGEG